MTIGNDNVQGDKHIHGDEVRGDKVVGNKVEIGSIVNTGGGQVNVAGGDINIFQRIVNFFQGDTEAQRAFRNRQNMLQLVWNTWIEGVLKKSLHNEVLIELGMETKSDAVEHPWDMVMQMPDREPEMVAPGTTMLELFDQASSSLLILGEPGSGKTTMLLDLARLAILRAQEEPSQPIPVVFNLSSWKPEQTMAAWLVDELKGKYYVSRKIGGSWVEGDDLLLLLDGLDEVKAENRAACVAAINAFRAEHSPLVTVCSRAQEYEELSARFNLRSAVLIQLLTREQVDEYLRAAGAGLASVHQALRQDAELQEFAQTPLILSILMLAYRDAIEKELQALGAGGDCRGQLFEAYIAQMFKRRGKEEGYSAEETRKWLSWLARKMAERGQSLFYIENIQLSRFSWPAGKTSLFLGLLSGLLVGLAIGLLTGLFFGPLVGLAIGLVVGLSVGRGTWQALKEEIAVGEDFRPAERLSWSWQQAKSNLVYRLVAGLLVTIILGLLGTMIAFAGLLGGLGGMLVSGLVHLPVGGLGGVLVYVLLVGLLVGLGGVLNSTPIENRSVPGEGVRTSAKIFILFGLVVGTSTGLVVGLATGSLGGLLIGLLGGLYTGLMNGGYFLIAHFAERFGLYRSGWLPWDVIAFLNYCTDRIFLRKVGGGYIFIHRMLMEHFAAMDEERNKVLVDER